MTTIETTAGPIDAGALGRTLCHEHLLTASEPIRVQYPHLVDHERELQRALELTLVVDEVGVLHADRLARREQVLVAERPAQGAGVDGAGGGLNRGHARCSFRMSRISSSRPASSERPSSGFSMPMRRWIASTGRTTKKKTAAAIEMNAISALRNDP